jgi:hypothetical protein
MRTVQDIVSNALMSLQLFRIEAEPHVSSPSLESFDQIIAETAGKLKALARRVSIRLQPEWLLPANLFISTEM